MKRIFAAGAALLAFAGAARAEVVELRCTDVHMDVAGSIGGDNPQAQRQPVSDQSFGAMRLDFERNLFFDGAREYPMAASPDFIAARADAPMNFEGSTVSGGAVFIDRRTGVLTMIMMVEGEGMWIRGAMTGQCRTADGGTAF